MIVHFIKTIIRIRNILLRNLIFIQILNLKVIKYLQKVDYFNVLLNLKNHKLNKSYYKLKNKLIDLTIIQINYKIFKKYHSKYQVNYKNHNL